jgi:hypothetical protein
VGSISPVLFTKRAQNPATAEPIDQLPFACQDELIISLFTGFTGSDFLVDFA